MVKIQINADCGNAPKREFLKDFNIAFAEGNLAYIAENITDDIIWTKVGDKQIEGKDAFLAELKQMNQQKTAEFTVDKVISHGRDGSANGDIVMSDGKHMLSVMSMNLRTPEIKAIASSRLPHM